LHKLSVVELVHRPSTPSLPVACLLTGSLLPPVCRTTHLTLHSANTDARHRYCLPRLSPIQCRPQWPLQIHHPSPYQFYGSYHASAHTRYDHHVRYACNKSEFRTYRGRRFDFCMCNPPFYTSTEEVSRSAAAKEFQPNAVCSS
jgi:hypothetical protein